MRKLFDSDGNEVDVPDEEEMKALQEASGKVGILKKSISAIRGKMGLKKGQKIIEQVDLMTEAANPNFTALRKKLSDKTDELTKATELLKENNVEFDGGSKNLNINPEEIEKNATEAGKKAATQTILDNEVSKHLSKYDEKQRPVVEKYYKKLINDEEVGLDNVSDFIGQAVKASGIEIDTKANTYVDGQPPVFEKSGEDFAETEKGKEMGKRLYGDDFGKTPEDRKKGDVK